MEIKIIKRNGELVAFDKEKIINALRMASNKIQQTKDRINEKEIKEIAEFIEFKAQSRKKSFSVEEIQDIIESELMHRGFKAVAKEYITYRYMHKLARERYQDLMKAMEVKLRAKDVQNQNANVDEKSFGGRVGESSDYMMKQYALDYCMSPLARNNHLNNLIYTHDLSAYAVGMHNCLTIPFDKLLREGFDTRQTDVRPAGSINTALQLVAVIFQLQSLQQFGGVSASHIDWTLVPYFRKSFLKHYKKGLKYIAKVNLNLKYDKNSVVNVSIDDDYWKTYPEVFDYALEMTIDETYQAVEAMYHNLNTLQSRSGNQLPFTSINYGTCTLTEGRLIIKAILDVSIKGIGKTQRTSIFPCGIFQVMKGVNKEPGTPNYDLFKLALKSTSQRLYPNYCNVNWSNAAGYDINDPSTYNSTMGCRTVNGPDINAEPGVNPQTKDGRGNLAPVTIILPEVAMLANRDPEKFIELLDQKIHEAKEILMERYEWLCSQSYEAAKFMYENGTMMGYKSEEGIRSALKHGTLVIGQVGLAETLELLVGENHCHEKGMEFAKRVEGLFKERCAQFKQEEHLNFGVYYTPAENLCYTSMKKFKDKYGVIEKVSDHEFWTNSMHVPVWEKVSIFDKIDIESQLTGYSNAGCITYVELETSVLNNIEALETIVNYAMDKDIPYFAINVPNDHCDVCGYTNEIGETCPVCGSTNIKRLRRVTGYLTGDYKTAFNKGKQQEVEMRVKHKTKVDE